MNIIVVDDNITFLKGIILFIENELGYRVREYYFNGKEFLENYQRETDDIILMDIEMPFINGINATKKSLWNCRELKLIAVTTYKENIQLTTLIEAGFKGCVFKDNIYDELQHTIHNVQKGMLSFPAKIKI